MDETDSCCFVLNDWSLGQIAAADFPKQGRYGQGVIALRLKEGTFVCGFFCVNSSNALLFVRYGNGRVRPLKISAAKPGRRARTLEPVTQNLLHQANGVTWLPLDPGPDAQPEPEAESPARKADPKPEEPAKPENPASDPEQASLF